MRTSCIRWSANQRLVLFREEQLAFCRGNICAAVLLSYFEYWHSIRMEQSAKSEYENRVAAAHNEAGMQNTSLWQFHTADDLVAGMRAVREKHHQRCAQLVGGTWGH